MPETEAMPHRPPQPWFAVALTVRSTDAALGAITAGLGPTPTSTHERGERLSQHDPSSPRRTENLWTLAASVLEAESLDEVVAGLLSRVAAAPTLPADCSVELTIGLTARPMGSVVELGSAVMRRLAGLGATLVLDVYDSEPD